MFSEYIEHCEHRAAAGTISGEYRNNVIANVTIEEIAALRRGFPDLFKGRTVDSTREPMTPVQLRTLHPLQRIVAPNSHVAKRDEVDSTQLKNARYSTLGRTRTRNTTRYTTTSADQIPPVSD